MGETKRGPLNVTLPTRHDSSQLTAVENSLIAPFNALRTALLALRQQDLALRADLEAEGALHDGYHPRMEAVHRDNAKQLRELIEHHGWPNERLAGPDGAEAAWLIAQHAIAEPEFMRRCRELIEKEAATGAVPFWHYAYLDDRIRVSEGKPQRFGTQFDITPDGPVLCEVENPQSLDARRQQAGLGRIEDHLHRMQDAPLPTPSAYLAKKEAELDWRRKVGWLAPRVA